MKELERAWRWREERGLFGELQALRVFHGPGEGGKELRAFAIDRFGGHYWVTQWERAAGGGVPAKILDFLRARGAASVVTLSRPEQGVPEEPQVLLGEPPEGRFTVKEPGLKFHVQMLKARHPGLFLDHAPLRQWLFRRARGWRVLNTFSYTGSLSVAAGAGGAAHVTTLDLAKPAIQWAEQNWALNGLASESARFIAGDVFEWLPRLRREGKLFDCVILDPPSFSRGKKGSFSTAKDLKKLHAEAMALLAPGGVLVTSINSAQISWSRYEADVLSAARECRREFEILSRIDLPETFPTRLGSEEDRYLKGWILRARQ
ncbi:MAG: class I SAM-dependent methyltransferase [Oligoflexia bacterium]|nr:class I SAM-dependent methyltransferase [Oligoflexia bacterium]